MHTISSIFTTIHIEKHIESISSFNQVKMIRFHTPDLNAFLFLLQLTVVFVCDCCTKKNGNNKNFFRREHLLILDQFDLVAIQVWK